jgi:hypothetical protein
MRFQSIRIVALVALTLSTACSRGDRNSPEAKTPITPPITAERKGGVATISQTGDKIALHNIRGTTMFEVEGVLTDPSFLELNKSLAQLPVAERKAAFALHMSQVTEKFRSAQALVTSVENEWGYFTMLVPYSDDLFASVKNIETESRVVLNPLIFNPEAVRSVKAFGPARENLTLNAGSRESLDHYSGLKSLGAPDFVRAVETELRGAVKVDGSSVRLGVTDTGITYNHPTFYSPSGKNRIVYMKDFTGEGTVFFQHNAKFSAVAGSTPSEMEISAEVIETLPLPSRVFANRLMAVQTKIKVSPELKAVLENPATKAKFGFISEGVFQAEGDTVDINANGKLDDKLHVILVEGATASDARVYLDTTGTRDFRNAKPMGDWNRTGDMVSVFAEKIGVQIESTVLLNETDPTDGEEAISVSIVGYDPGNHGSHVSGIAAGMKTVSGNSDDTLARGVAPGAQIVLGRVCSNNAGCNYHAAITDLVKYGKAEVINMSLGSLSPFNDGYGVGEVLINRLTAVNNVLFVISAGNSGPGKQTIGSPSAARRALSVGATANRAMIQRQYGWVGAGSSPLAGPESDFLLYFSSRGPTAAGGFKPNVTAPGTEMSSIQLNAAPGARAGLSVIWGTSMASPAAAGAYALLLDAVKKFNNAYPAAQLSTSALLLREVLIQSARSFDVKTHDLTSGNKTDGQYTWVDQGTGMVNLPGAWALLKAYRDNPVPTAVTKGGVPIELDYQVLTNLKSPSGVAYDGTRVIKGVPPVFGTGIYLDYNGKETLKNVVVTRRIPEALSTSPDLGELSRQLVTTRDEFVLKTVMHGSDVPWVKAGVLDQLPCMDSPTANYSIFGRGGDYSIAADGTATLTAGSSTPLIVCVDRQAIRTLQPGDHGALIYAFRTVGGLVAPVPSFVVPVYVSVPHRVLENNSGYDISSTAESFGLSRNYVFVPTGTSVVRVTIEVPAAKLDRNGLVIPDSCAGVDLLANDAINTSRPTPRGGARVQNCESNGSPSAPQKRVLSFSKTSPNAGLWDLHVLGLPKMAKSPYRLRVDYVTGESSIKKIEGPLSALTGAFDWTLKEASAPVSPDSAKSSFEILGLRSTVEAAVGLNESLRLAGPLGLMRKYGPEVLSVTIKTGSSPGNDLDMVVVACPAGLAAPVERDCKTVGVSGGPADEESVTFEPAIGKEYAVIVHGYAIKDAGKFKSEEVLKMKTEKGMIQVTSSAPTFHIQYGFDPAAFASSAILNHPSITTGKYRVTGSIVLKTGDEVVLDSLAVDVGQ